jgi:hypothetical protein
VRRVRCFYEDDPGEQVKNFGPHALTLATIADRTGTPQWTLASQVEAVPKKGVAKLLKAVALEQPHDGLRVLALVDDDRIRTQLGLAADATDEVVMARLSAEVPGVTFVRLVRNVDDLVRHTSVALGLSAPTGKSTPRERDRVLNAAAAGARSVRDVVTGSMPSWASWVSAVEVALTA